MFGFFVKSRSASSEKSSAATTSTKCWRTSDARAPSTVPRMAMMPPKAASGSHAKARPKASEIVSPIGRAARVVVLHDDRRQAVEVAGERDAPSRGRAGC